MQDNRFNLQQCHMVPNQSIKMFINVKKNLLQTWSLLQTKANLALKLYTTSCE